MASIVRSLTTDRCGCGRALKPAMLIVTIACGVSGWLVKLEDASEAYSLTWWVPLASSELPSVHVSGLGNLCASNSGSLKAATHQPSFHSTARRKIAVLRRVALYSLCIKTALTCKLYGL